MALVPKGWSIITANALLNLDDIGSYVERVQAPKQNGSKLDTYLGGQVNFFFKELQPNQMAIVKAKESFEIDGAVNNIDTVLAEKFQEGVESVGDCDDNTQPSPEPEIEGTPIATWCAVNNYEANFWFKKASYFNLNAFFDFLDSNFTLISSEGGVLTYTDFKITYSGGATSEEEFNVLMDYDTRRPEVTEYITNYLHSNFRHGGTFSRAQIENAGGVSHCYESHCFFKDDEEIAND